MEKNIISVSGGKDSTALLLFAIEKNKPDLKAVFADTGNEHPITYEYIEYLAKNVYPITIIKADFSDKLKQKRENIQKRWSKAGIAQDKIERALNALKPTGIPFLDLCLYKGRFPSPGAAFCTSELKKKAIEQQIYDPLLNAGYDVTSWIGVRADESARRASLKEFELIKIVNDAELNISRPLLHWTAQDCFELHKKHGIEPNPLYKLGMSRVGCMPCVQCRKSELKEIAINFPEEIKRINDWEKRVSNASKRDSATYFPAKPDANGQYPTIDIVVEQYTSNNDLEFPEISACRSVYGLCE